MLSLEAPKLCAVLKRWRRLGGARCFQTLLCSETSGAYSCVSCASSTACVRACAGACAFACARACLGGAQGFPKPCALVRRWCFYKALVPLGLRMVLNLMFSQGFAAIETWGGSKPSGFTGSCCLRSMGRLRTLVFSQGPLPSKPGAPPKPCGRLQNLVFS